MTQINQRYKLTTTVDKKILKEFRKNYHGSIGSFLDGAMTIYLFLKKEEIENKK